MPKVHEMMSSKYLKREDVGEDGTVLTIEKFERVNVAMEDATPEFKWVCHFREQDRPMVMNTTNIQLAEKMFNSDDTDDWIGKRLIAYNDPNVAFGGKLVGGIRIRKISGGQPRQPAGNDGFDTDITPESGEKLLHAAAKKGTDALRAAWTALPQGVQEALKPKLAGLKEIAANPAPEEDDIHF